MEDGDFRRMPGLYRLWDIHFVIDRSQDWRISYASLTADGTPLFAVYRCTPREVGHDLD